MARVGAGAGMVAGYFSAGYGLWLMDGAAGSELGQHFVFGGLVSSFALLWLVLLANGLIEPLNVRTRAGSRA